MKCKKNILGEKSSKYNDPKKNLAYLRKRMETSVAGPGSLRREWHKMKF